MASRMNDRRTPTIAEALAVTILERGGIDGVLNRAASNGSINIFQV